tara:strand:+ start:4819 stop:5508 length:690 start_codon:yes stop_codon:yes gene_type:complete
MQTLAIIQARMNSRRLPNKVLKRISGNPVISYVVKALQFCDNISDVVVATSKEEADQPIVNYCQEHNIRFLRGSLTDVAQRYRKVALQYGISSFVRICADSPLHDPATIDKAIKTFSSNNYDLVTNTFPRTFPVGVSVEVVNAESFLSSTKLFVSKHHREHVTRYFYDHPEKYKIFNLVFEPATPSISLAVDSKEDFSLVTKIIESMDRPPWEYSIREKIKLYREHSKI